MILEDKAILARMKLPDDDPMHLSISPFMSESPKSVISFGLSSGGYDMRLDTKFKIFTNARNALIDPKKMDPQAFVEHEGDTCIIPPNSFVLGSSIEKFHIPRDVLGICIGKSTYARCGIIATVTPLEPQWCLSEDTEILTCFGWRYLSEIGKGEYVLTRREDGIAEYQAIQAKQNHEYNAFMIHFDGRSVNQLVTPNHELFVHKRIAGNNHPPTIITGKVPANEVYGKHNYSFDRKVNWRGIEEDTLYIVGRNWNAGDFLEFYGSWLGDGSAYHGTDGGYHVKLAVVTKEEKRRKFLEILQKLGFKYSLNERGFQFFDKELCLWLREHDHARYKHIKRNFLNFSAPLLERLLAGLMQSDGCALTNAYTTVSRRLADDVQELIFKCGRAAIIREEKTKYGNRYVIRDCDDHMTPKMKPENHSIERYKGMVYDVTVPNHVFLCRRNGKVSWTGNCGTVTIEISNTTPLPAIVYANEGIVQVVFCRMTNSCNRSYADKKGRYQNQKGITLPFVGNS